MEKRIKTLYIITIIAILAFLGMQVYWLYGRYEFSLSEHEAEAYKSIVQIIGDYNHNRPGGGKLPGGFGQTSRYQIHTGIDSLGLSSRTASVRTNKYYAHDLLGIKERRPLTKEEQDSATKILLEDTLLLEPQDSMTISFDATNAPSDAAIWGAFKNIDTEFLSPLSREETDSVLSAGGFVSEVSLAVADSVVWEPVITRHATVFDPTTEFMVPYSELEKKIVVVSNRIPVIDVFRGMLGSLVVVAVLSVFLIVCLVLQFSTVLKLSRLDKMRSSFITTMIHELKRPISTLKMCVSGLDNERMMEDEATKKELLCETRNALDNLAAYFTKLRDITFNNVEQIPLNIQSVNLRELFGNVASTVAVANGKSVNIKNEIDGATEVSADRTHLYNILNNLVENAIKYSGPDVEITATATDNHGAVELRIADTGYGISPGDIKHIFNRFYRGAASATETPGMGLGLAYVKLLVEAHGGKVEVESQRGEGSVFKIIIPQ